MFDDKDGNIRKLRKNISTCEENEKIGEFTGVVKLSKKASQMFVDKYSELEDHHTKENSITHHH